MSTAANLNERRTRLRMTAKELAEKAGLHKDTVHRVLKGVVDPQQSTVERIDNALRVEEQTMATALVDRRA